MAEIWFYHLERRPLEAVLPLLLERSLARGWSAVVQAASGKKLEEIDALLWTYADDSFLPHARAGEGDAARQPVYLTLGAETPNKAQVRFCVEGADPLEGAREHERVVVLFDGRDPDALALARRQWAALKGAPHGRTYWQMGEDGRWERKG